MKKKAILVLTIIAVALLCLFMMGCVSNTEALGEEASANGEDIPQWMKDDHYEGPLNGTTEDGFVYSLDFGGYGYNYMTIKGYKGTDENVVIPAEIEGYPVYVIGVGAFRNSKIQSVVIPDIIKEVCTDAFEYCKNLTNFVLPKDLTTIETCVFRYCSALTEIVLPSNIIEIEGGAFQGCTSLTKVVLPNGVMKLGGGAFMGCTALTEIFLPSNVVEIGTSTFKECTSLREIMLPDGLQIIGWSAFEGCTSFTEVVLPQELKYIGDTAFKNCINLEEIVLPDNAFQIGDDTFANTIYLDNMGETVIIKGMLLKMETRAEDVELIIPDGVISIGIEMPFGNKIEKIILPSSAKNLSDIYRDCYKLQEIIVDEENEYYQTVDGVLYDKAMTKIIYYPCDRQAESYSYPEGMRPESNILDYAKNLKHLIIPASETFEMSYFYDAELFEQFHITEPCPLYVFIRISLYNYLGLNYLESIRFLCAIPTEIEQITEFFEKELPNVEIIWGSEE